MHGILPLTRHRALAMVSGEFPIMIELNPEKVHQRVGVQFIGIERLSDSI
jgi:hypothetical protein